jgi:glyoxylase-like metal-dependent hydrolase (beta-lactamase superfamily II)
LSENVEILFSRGHTPGHQSVAIESEKGLEIIVAQAAYSAAEFATFAGNDEPRVRDDAWSKSAYAASLRQLHAMKPRLAYFSHDSSVWSEA